MGIWNYTSYKLVLNIHIIKNHLSAALCSSLSQLISHWEQRLWCI